MTKEIKTYSQIYNEIKAIGGWFSKQDIQRLRTLKLPKKAVILELGTGSGRSTVALRRLWPDAYIATCDPNVDPTPQIKDLNVRFYPMAGADLSWKKPIDLLFVDDNHEYNTVKSDILKYKDFIKPKGYMVFHDYHGTLGVPKAVDEMLSNVRVYQTGEYSQAIWRNND